MAQPVWITPAGSLGVIPEGIFYQQTLLAEDPDGGEIYYAVIAGTLPEGIQCAANGLITGVPQAVASLQGVPTEVSQDITSKFTIRVYTDTVPPLIRDRTFTLTITGNDVPEFITPAGPLSTYNSITGQWEVEDTYYDGGLIDYQIQYTNQDPNDTVTVRLVAGELPGGVTVTANGLITGYIQPAANINETPGYDITPIYTEPYDFIISSVSRTYQFTLEVSDGKSSNLRTFEFFVYDRASLTADNTTITADTTTVTADEGLERAPFLLNAVPNNLGTVRSDNYYAYQFIGRDYDTPNIRYAIGVNQGAGLPPGLALDPVTGWYYGYLPDQGVTAVEYSFNIVTYQTDFVGTPISCTATTFGTNRITCNDTSQLGTGQPILFTGTAFGGVTASATQVYYVLSVVNSTQFTITNNVDSNTPVTLTTAAGSMTANLIVASQPYPFTITLSGAVDAEVTWLTDSNLGTIVNGETSLFRVEAVNRGGRELLYRLEEGAFNELPQGLQLLPTGEISGRASFNTFAIDLGATTIANAVGVTLTWAGPGTSGSRTLAQYGMATLVKVASDTWYVNGTGLS